MSWFRANNDRLKWRRERVRVLAKLLRLPKREVIYILHHAQIRGES